MQISIGIFWGYRLPTSLKRQRFVRVAGPVALDLILKMYSVS
jgi:hypothetical protein